MAIDLVHSTLMTVARYSRGSIGRRDLWVIEKTTKDGTVGRGGSQWNGIGGEGGKLRND